MKNELEIKFTIEFDDYKREQVKEDIYEFLKKLDVVKLEMEEK